MDSNPTAIKAKPVKVYQEYILNGFAFWLPFIWAF